MRFQDYRNLLTLIKHQLFCLESSETLPRAEHCLQVSNLFSILKSEVLFQNANVPPFSSPLPPHWFPCYHHHLLLPFQIPVQPSVSSEKLPMIPKTGSAPLTHEDITGWSKVSCIAWAHEKYLRQE